MLTGLMEQLAPLGRETSPFGTKVLNPAARDARWVEPRLVGEVAADRLGARED
jgi:bifunctional non-homologous end joining protein LigD